MTDSDGRDAAEPGKPDASERTAADVAGAECNVDPRIHAAWREWLAALATDAEAGIAAAHVYAELPAPARDAWLDALAEDHPNLGVPPVAIYAPLLSVETDPARRARMEQAMGVDTATGPR